MSASFVTLGRSAMVRSFCAGKLAGRRVRCQGRPSPSRDYTNLHVPPCGGPEAGNLVATAPVGASLAAALALFVVVPCDVYAQDSGQKTRELVAALDKTKYKKKEKANVSIETYLDIKNEAAVL